MHRHWHPWFRQWRLERRHRGGAWSLARWTAGLAVVIAPLVALADEGAHAALAGAGLRWFVHWPLAIGVTLAMLAHIAVRTRLRPLAHELRSGWWAAMPIAPRSTTQALVIVGAVIALVASLAGALVLALLALAARSPAPFTAAVGVLVSGIASGAALGVAASLRRTPPARIDGRRRPLWRLAALNDARLPHLFDWQHRAAVLRWRRGNGTSVIAMAMLLLPGGATPAGASGLLLLATVLAWFRAALTGASEAATQAAVLMRALPLTPHDRRRALLRYPLFATACALSWCALAVALLGPGVELALLVATMVLAAALRPAVSLWRASR
ncbi:hypothetical protein ACFOLC_13320 [Lysobacter cavernae]|uniref:ABC transporter permease n=1 Tax=Lysobacter cavernae TaxID=1685901 RepID=A0ABV7RR51_9GAMM